MKSPHAFNLSVLQFQEPEKEFIVRRIRILFPAFHPWNIHLFHRFVLLFRLQSHHTTKAVQKIPLVRRKFAGIEIVRLLEYGQCTASLIKCSMKADFDSEEWR